MSVTFKIFLILYFAGSVLMFPDYSSEIRSSEVSEQEHSEELTTEKDDSFEVTTSSNKNLETEEICTCCPGLSTLFDESTIAESVTKQLKEDLSKLDEEFTSKKEELQNKTKQINEEAEPHKEKLREVRKANRDRETELKIEELSEKSSTLRKSFKELIKKVNDLSESRLNAKREYNTLGSACRVKKGDDDYDEDKCKTSLAEKLETIEKSNGGISTALTEMKTKHDEIVEVENQLKIAEEELWITIYKNRKTIDDDIVKVSESYKQISTIKNELEELGKKHVNDQRSLQLKAARELDKFAPSKYSWISWSNSRSDVPSNSLNGGYDLDGSVLYVIRYQKDDGTYEYGKFSVKRSQAYVTRDDEEKIVYDFDLLVGGNFVWCSPSNLTSNETSSDIPICRANVHDSLIPGAFLADGNCRVGFGLESHEEEDDFEILKQGKC